MYQFGPQPLLLLQEVNRLREAIISFFVIVNILIT